MPLSNIEILHQDDALLVINKPTLLLSVPGRADDNKDCLVTRLQENGYPEARIVHRLDWETSGIIVLARDADSHRELSRQFHDRETEKAYTALCWGQPELDSGSIDLPLRYDPPTKPRHVVDHELGKHALTWLQLADSAGMATGIISTARLTHATPAATYAHALSPCDTGGYERAIRQLILSTENHAQAYRELMNPTQSAHRKESS